jgi:phytoene dehydrogenase-like protein
VRPALRETERGYSVDLGIAVRLNSEVAAVRKDGARVTGIVADAQFHPADIVVSNTEVIPFSEHQRDHFRTVLLDIRQQYYSNPGAIYGVVSDRFKNLAFKAPKQSTKYPNLFFVGGSANPGGGMPMVVLCGQNVARKVREWDRGVADRGRRSSCAGTCGPAWVRCRVRPADPGLPRPPYR